MYKYTRQPNAKNPATVVVDRRSRTPVIRQVRAHLFCWDCEQCLRKNGEDWMMRQIWNGRRFPLLDRLNVAMELRRTADGVLIYSGSAAGIDTDKLAYFALSVLWRAGVHDWTVSKHSTFRIDLEGHGEKLRQYLHGDTGFPTDVTVMATVCTDIYSRLFYMPTVARFPTPITAFSILALGVHLLIILGILAPAQMCCVRSPQHVLFKRDCKRKTLESVSQLILDSLKE